MISVNFSLLHGSITPYYTRKYEKYLDRLAGWILKDLKKRFKEDKSIYDLLQHRKVHLRDLEIEEKRQ